MCCINGQTININSSCIVVVGDRADANMATAVALLAKERGRRKINKRSSIKLLMLIILTLPLIRHIKKNTTLFMGP
jgi:hypothetical protein